MFRLFRNQHKAKTKLRLLLVFQLSAIFSLTAAICLQFTGDTSAAFHDIENLDVSLQTCENFQHTDKNCHYDKRWDQSDLHVVNQTDTKGTVCSPVSLFAELENRGEKLKKSKWKWELHKLANTSKPLKDGNVIDKGYVSNQIGESLYKIETKKKVKPGIYAFKVYKPAGYPADGSKYEWSEPMTIGKCDEKPTAPKKESQQAAKTQHNQAESDRKEEADKEKTADKDVTEDKENQQVQKESGEEDEKSIKADQ
ncbi:amyloid fiber anchoring/assembly protein TapA [Bacillus mojavensis]|uniref:YqxM protein n=1 Tax=Bacillus mojavensis TaxID=72360 RepID=A0ABX6LY63_BACMO|nr:amyloid fiber anchoring/assembly protein TapA [Bacillus mojavensis]MEC1625113.1 amyloid fiber anchoring/assembly protein TapA [Bacillus mojavensis]MEC1668847.1 amyloid fiber anchoring/assembly protein TapA [Bacillus mojavensis]MEC1671867.1 amyloid fiber anchoring/assembly protein TapA [Bacillus mojavensis]QJC96819.1 YqxM protein [Bacillus mojavensis]